MSDRQLRWLVALGIVVALYAVFPNPFKQAWCTNITGGTWVPTARYGGVDEPEIVESGVCLNDEELEEFNRFKVENDSTFP